jgi:hypothetical protein
MTLNKKTAVFWDVMQCSLVEQYQIALYHIAGDSNLHKIMGLLL